MNRIVRRLLTTHNQETVNRMIGAMERKRISFVLSELSQTLLYSRHLKAEWHELLHRAILENSDIPNIQEKIAMLITQNPGRVVLEELMFARIRLDRIEEERESECCCAIL